METNRLRQFCVIADTGSLTKAAQLLHITHSGLSKSMKILQEELGCILLRPSGRGLMLTDDGLRVYKQAKEFLAQEEVIFKAKPLAQQKSLRIGTVESFLHPLCKQLTLHPLTSSPITLLDLSPGQMEQMIANRELDYGITYAPCPMENVDIIEIEKYQLGCYRLAGSFENIAITDIPFAVPAIGLTNNPLGIKERDGWIESLTPRNRRYFVNLLSTGLELTLQGLCAIYIAKFVASNINNTLSGNKKLVEVALPKAQKNEQRLFLMKHKHQALDSQFKLLKKMLKSIIKGQ